MDLQGFVNLKFVSFLKLSYIMEEARIKFYGSNGTEKKMIEVLCNDGKFIEVYIEDNQELIQFISLNKATAVQLVKRLKLEISKIESHGTR